MCTQEKKGYLEGKGCVCMRSSDWSQKMMLCVSSRLHYSFLRQFLQKKVKQELMMCSSIYALLHASRTKKSTMVHEPIFCGCIIYLFFYACTYKKAWNNAMWSLFIIAVAQPCWLFSGEGEENIKKVFMGDAKVATIQFSWISPVD